MNKEFLLKEYDQCHEQLRYYDSRQNEILKYSYTITTASAASIFAIFKLFPENSLYFSIWLLLLSFVVFIATLLLYTAMLQNRLYFIFTARQINAIRDYMLKTEAIDFNNNQLYRTTKIAAFKPSSVHTIQMIGVAALSTSFYGICAYSVPIALGYAGSPPLQITTTLVVGLTEITLGILYLKSNSKLNADTAIHNQHN